MTEKTHPAIRTGADERFVPPTLRDQLAVVVSGAVVAEAYRAGVTEADVIGRDVWRVVDGIVKARTT